jgi:hypothetical protein
MERRNSLVPDALAQCPVALLLEQRRNREEYKQLMPCLSFPEALVHLYRASLSLPDSAPAEAGEQS